MNFGLHTVVSSNIEMIGYDRDAKELTVVFKNGSTYVYSDVPLEVYVAFDRAPSAGSFLAASIRGRYAFRKV
jgi:KTSC domain